MLNQWLGTYQLLAAEISEKRRQIQSDNRLSPVGRQEGLTALDLQVKAKWQEVERDHQQQLARLDQELDQLKANVPAVPDPTAAEVAAEAREVERLIGRTAAADNPAGFLYAIKESIQGSTLQKNAFVTGFARVLALMDVRWPEGKADRERDQLLSAMRGHYARAVEETKPRVLAEHESRVLAMEDKRAELEGAFSMVRRIFGQLGTADVAGADPWKQQALRPNAAASDLPADGDA